MHVDVDAGKEEVDPVLLPHSILAEDNSDYICGTALFPPYRGHGLGTPFLELAENQARERKLPNLSLTVFRAEHGRQAAI